jgi:hypothetical protein
MKKLTALILGFGLTLASHQVLAHGNHADVEPIDHTEASGKAQQMLEKLVGGNKLPASWNGAKATDISPKKSHHGDTVWVVHYVNSTEKDAAKQNLFIVLDEVGNVLSAEHTEKL